MRIPWGAILICDGHCNVLPQTCGFKQHKCIILQFWWSEVWFRSHRAKIKVSAGLSSFLEASGQPVGVLHHFFVFTPSSTHLHSLTHSPAFSKPAMAGEIFLGSQHSHRDFSAFPLLQIKDPGDYIGPTQIIQANLLILRSIDYNFNSIFISSSLSCNLT